MGPPLPALRDEEIGLNQLQSLVREGKTQEGSHLLLILVASDSAANMVAPLEELFDTVEGQIATGSCHEYGWKWTVVEEEEANSLSVDIVVE